MPAVCGTYSYPACNDIHECIASRMQVYIACNDIHGVALYSASKFTQF